MKVRNTEIKVLFRKNKIIKSCSIRQIRSVDESSLRQWAASVLNKAYRHSACTAQLFIDKQHLGEFKPVWAAKIITQEILKAVRQDNKDFKTIIIYVEDYDTCQVFQKQVFGYIQHIVEHLGQGPYATVDLIIEFPEGIVLIERSNPPLGWALPGGFVDYGESLEEAAVREGKEETNLKLTGLKQFHTYSKPSRDPRFHTISTVFMAKGKGKPKAGDDAKGLMIVPFKDLLKRSYPFDHKKVIQDYLEYR